MPWIPIKGGLKKAREAVGLSQLVLAIRANVSLRTVKALESRKPPRTMFVSTHAALTKALKDPKAPTKPTLPFARWLEGNGERARGASAKPSVQDAAQARTDMLPARSTVSLRADRERALDLHDRRIETTSGELPLLGVSWFKKIWSRPTKHDGQRFVVVGCVEDHQGINPSIRKTFKVQDGGKYLVVRWLDHETPYYATVFAFSCEHADELTSVADSRGEVAMIVRVLSAPPTDEWKGFTFFGKDRTSHDFAFVCEEVLKGVPSVG